MGAPARSTGAPRAIGGPRRAALRCALLVVLGAAVFAAVAQAVEPASVGVAAAEPAGTAAAAAAAAPQASQFVGAASTPLWLASRSGRGARALNIPIDAPEDKPLTRLVPAGPAAGGSAATGGAKKAAGGGDKQPSQQQKASAAKNTNKKQAAKAGKGGDAAAAANSKAAATAKGASSSGTKRVPASYVVQVAAQPAALSLLNSTAARRASISSAGDGGSPDARAHKAAAAAVTAQVSAVSGAAGLASKVATTFNSALSGFVVSGPTPAQLRALAADPAVIGIWPDEAYQLATYTTPEFLDLTRPGGEDARAPAYGSKPAYGYEAGGSAPVWEQLGGVVGPDGAGEDVVIGVIDSGIYMDDHPSFAEASYWESADLDNGQFYEPLPNWAGTCQANADGSPFRCNNKVIGCRWFDPFDDGGSTLSSLFPYEQLGCKDYSGHGTVTAAIAGGNYGAESPYTPHGALLSGMAPRARLAVYKACWGRDEGAAGCYLSSLLMALDAAVADGVDVIDLPVASGLESWGLQGLLSTALRNAANAGIFVAAAAGNFGPSPGTVRNLAPWITTVAASTQPRSVEAAVHLGCGWSFGGSAPASQAPLLGPKPLVYGGEAAVRRRRDAAGCGPGSLDPEAANDAIVVCELEARPSFNAIAAKVAEVSRAKGCGVLFVQQAPPASTCPATGYGYGGGGGGGALVGGIGDGGGGGGGGFIPPPPFGGGGGGGGGGLLPDDNGGINGGGNGWDDRLAHDRRRRAAAAMAAVDAAGGGKPGVGVGGKNSGSSSPRQAGARQSGGSRSGLDDIIGWWGAAAWWAANGWSPALRSSIEAEWLETRFPSLPYVVLPPEAREALLEYVWHDVHATAEFGPGTFEWDNTAPLMAPFSGRGPAPGLEAGLTLKPDITAPGVNIHAADSPLGRMASLYNTYQGTSLSASHIAGIAALLRDKYPDWSPMAIKSALMTSAYQLTKTGRAGLPFGGPLDYGAGHVSPPSALHPGLLITSGIEDWIALICAAERSYGAVTVPGCPLPLEIEFPNNRWESGGGWGGPRFGAAEAEAQDAEDAEGGDASAYAADGGEASEEEADAAAGASPTLAAAAAAADGSPVKVTRGSSSRTQHITADTPPPARGGGAGGSKRDESKRDESKKPPAARPSRESHRDHDDDKKKPQPLAARPPPSHSSSGSSPSSGSRTTAAVRPPPPRQSEASKRASLAAYTSSQRAASAARRQAAAGAIDITLAGASDPFALTAHDESDDAPGTPHGRYSGYSNSGFYSPNSQAGQEGPPDYYSYEGRRGGGGHGRRHKHGRRGGSGGGGGYGRSGYRDQDDGGYGAGGGYDAWPYPSDDADGNPHDGVCLTPSPDLNAPYIVGHLAGATTFARRMTAVLSAAEGPVRFTARAGAFDGSTFEVAVAPRSFVVRDGESVTAFITITPTPDTPLGVPQTGQVIWYSDDGKYRVAIPIVATFSAFEYPHELHFDPVVVNSTDWSYTYRLSSATSQMVEIRSSGLVPSTQEIGSAVLSPQSNWQSNTIVVPSGNAYAAAAVFAEDISPAGATVGIYLYRQVSAPLVVSGSCWVLVGSDANPESPSAFLEFENGLPAGNYQVVVKVLSLPSNYPPSTTVSFTLNSWLIAEEGNSNPGPAVMEVSPHWLAMSQLDPCCCSVRLDFTDVLPDTKRYIGLLTYDSCSQRRLGRTIVYVIPNHQDASGDPFRTGGGAGARSGGPGGAGSGGAGSATRGSKSRAPVEDEEEDSSS